MIFRTIYSIIFLSLFFANFSANGQQVSGKVTNQNNEAVPFLTVYKEGTTIGTTTNENGVYFLNLTKGKHWLVFRSLGYETQTKEITISNSLTLDVQMKEQTVLLQEIQVNSKDKDPAYGIIRAAQKKRKYYLKEVDEYSCKVYIKGLDEVLEAPKKIMGYDITIPGAEKDSINSGIVYFSESVSKYYFQQPNKEKEVVISSKTSGKTNGFSWNSALDFAMNIYQNTIETGLHDRPFVSPISATALFYYKYKLIGTFEDKGVLVNKIKVIPRTKGTPLFSGTFNIIEDSWRVHSTDFYITKNTGIEYIDTLWLKQTYFPVKDSVWVVNSALYEYNYNIKMVKVRGKGRHLAVYSDYDLKLSFRNLKTEITESSENPTTEIVANLPNSTEKRNKKKPKNLEKELLKASKKFFTKEVSKIEKEANKRSDDYWDKIRPVKLTEIEIKDYQLKDSIEVVHDSKVYKDSLDKKSNKFKVINIINGYTYQHRFRNQYYSFPSLLEGIQFNTVEGYNINPSFQFIKRNKETNTYLSLKATFRYGFSSKTPYYKFRFYRRFNAQNRERISLEAGKFVSQFNAENPISPFINAYYSLLYAQNYMKIYEKSYAKFSYSREVFNGIRLSSSLEYSQRNALMNTTEEAFRSDVSSYGANNPLDAQASTPFFEKHAAFIWETALKIRFRQKYVSRPDYKYVYESKYPELHINYKKAFKNVLGSSVSYDLLQFGSSGKVKLGLFGKTKFNINYGTFLTKENVQFMDFKHFMTSQTLFSNNRFDSFFLLPYYENSTTNDFLETHFEHHFNGFIFNKIPLFKKLKWQTLAGIHYLNTKDLGNYLELNIGVKNIFKVGRLDFVTSFKEGKKASTGVRFRFGF